MDLDLTVLFNPISPSWAIPLNEAFLFELLLSIPRRRATALSNGQRNWNVCRGSPLVPLHVSIARKRAAVEGVKRRLASDILRTSGSSRSFPFDFNVEISLHYRLAAVRGKGAVGDLGWGGLFEEIVAAASIKPVVLAEGFAFHDPGAAALVVIANVDVATAAARETVALVKVEVIFHITTSTAPSHALEPVAVPSFAAARRFVVVVQVSGRGTIHYGVVCNEWVLMSVELDSCGAQHAIKKQCCSERTQAVRKKDARRQEDGNRRTQAQCDRAASLIAP